jgi:hypothetical protein
MRLPAALLLAVVAAGCTSSSPTTATSPSTSPTPSRPATAPSVASPSPSSAYVVQVKPTTPGRFDIVGFASPSHNISCALLKNEDGTGVARCDIAARSWKLPPPSEPCEFDWGSVATINTRWRKGQMGACVSDAAGGTEVLAYGHAMRLGDVECRSSRAGVECVVLRTRHGFFVSKASYRLF